MYRTKPSLLLIAASLLGTLAAAPVARATTYVMMSDEALVADSPIIIDGTVEERFERGDAKTSYWVRVDEVLKGIPGAARILVRIPGGAAAKGMTYRVHGAPELRVGERAVLFLVGTGADVYGINQLGLGLFKRVSDRTGVWAERELGGEFLGSESGAGEVRSAEPLERRGWSELRNLVRRLSSGTAQARLTAPLGQGAAEAGFQSSDGVNAIIFNDPFGEVPGSYVCGSGGVVAIGGSWGSGPHVFKATSFGSNVESDIITNNNTACFYSISQANQLGVFSHELGHTLGLGHTDPTPSLMYSVYGGNSNLQQNDRDVIAYLYGAANPCAATSCALLGPSRWNVFPATVSWMFESTGFDCAGGGLSGFQNALAVWNNDPNSSISYVYGGTIQGDCAALPAPTGLSALEISATTTQLSWTDNATTETEYAAEVDSTNNGVDDFQRLSPLLPANTTVVNVTGLQPSAPNRFRVMAIRQAGPFAGSPYSNVAQAAPQGSSPAPPTGLAATALSSSSIQLTWSDTSGDETSFRIERFDGFAFSEISFVGVNQTSFFDSGRAPSTLYTYRVRARNGNGDSGYTNQASATTLASGGSPPNAPTSLVATALSSSSIQLTWADNATNETNYLAEIDPTANGLDDFQQLSPLLASNATGATATNLTASTLYRFRVKALNGSGDSLYSNLGQATTLAATGSAPSAPANLVASALSSTAIQLTWTDTSSDETSFRVERESAGSFVEIGSTPAGQTAFTDNGLSPSTSYSYRVRSRNANGDSTYSNTAAATTLPGGGGPNPPAAPEGLAAVALVNGHIILTWADRSSDEDSFIVEHEEAAGFQALLTLGANQQFAELAGLATGRVHRFQVKARNAAGDSAYSNVASAALAAPAPPAGSWLTTAEIPGFRFKTRIGNDREGTQVLDCVPGTLCVAGSIPSRTELFLRVIGPRPNGKLWAQVVRFTVSGVEVWVEQNPGGTLRYYDLAALPASTTALGGLNDSEAFSPAESASGAVDELIFRDFSDLRLATTAGVPDAIGNGGSEANPPPPGGDWLTTPELSGFRFKARIGEGSSLRSGTKVLDCVPQTLCVAGSLPDRTELLVRLIGPRPNGFLWAQLVRFTVAPVELWVEQETTHVVRYYALDKLFASSTELPGRNDSEAFLP